MSASFRRRADSTPNSFARYFTDMLGDYWLPQNKEEGKEELNTTAYAHVVTADVDEGNKHNTHRPPYNSCEIRDGKVVILFHADWLGSNPSSYHADLSKAL